MGLTIDQMRLNPVARAGAVLLKEQHPSVIFTSGRRDRWKQALAMACNVAIEREWISATYLHAAVFQTWVDLHPEATTVEQLAHGFYELMQTLTDTEVEQLTKHMGGNAWDVLPMVKDAAGTPTAEGLLVIETIRTLPGLDKFLTREGRLVRWHAQFMPSAEV